MMSASEIRAAEYRAKAQEARDRSQASPLPQVRERLETAASTWEGLARLEDARTLHLLRRYGRAAEAQAALAAAATAGDPA